MKSIITLSLTVVLSTASVAVVPPLTPIVVAPVSQSNMLLLAGPLQSYNAQTGIAVILGQNVSVGAQSLPGAGLTVAVLGTINSDGSRNVSSISGSNVYVPGATDIFLTGVVKTSNPVLDLVTVGGVTVDLTLALASGVAVPPVGATIQLVGTQPAIGGLIIAQAINVGPLQNVTSASLLSLNTFVSANIPTTDNTNRENDIGITGSGHIGIQH